MRIAVTGASGFIGQCFLRRFAGKHEMVAFVSDPGKQGLHRSPQITYHAVARPHGASDVEALADTYRGLLAGCDAAVNLGFRRSTPGKAGSFSDFIPSIAATEALFEACAQGDVRNVVHISTQAAYAKHTPLPHTEDEPAAPFSFYGSAKVATEAMASVYNASGRLQVKVLRLAQVLGVNEHQGVVAVYARAMREGKPLMVYGTGHESSREYVYVRDVCDAIMAAIGHPQCSGVYNIGTGEPMDALALASAIASLDATGNTKVQPLPEKAVEHVDFLMSSDKAARELDWTAAHDTRAALEAMWADEGGLY